MTVKDVKEKLEKYSDDTEIVFVVALTHQVLEYSHKVHCVADKVILVNLKKLGEK